MALSLTASQKNLMDLFVNENLYVIPAYQRSYSWNFDQVFQLYSDLLNSYSEGNSDYFVGNLILAVSNNKYEYNVVDGQQRLITLWLLIKMCSIVFPEMTRLKRLLVIQDWEDEEMHPRIKSNVFESSDQEEISYLSNIDVQTIENRLLRVVNSKGKIVEIKCSSKLEYNALQMYQWIKFRKDRNEDDAKGFVKFLLESVYLLPIELYEDNIEMASAKALKIFETLNDRGLNLEDADIFKEKLYRRSIVSHQDKDFIYSWTSLKRSCDHLNIDIDELFKYYYHIIRGKNDIVSNEQSLRDFFVSNSLSPLDTRDYREILNDLSLILNVLGYLSFNQYNDSEVSAWIQLVLNYTNQYPKIALVTYLYKNNFDKTDSLMKFLRSLVRYCYSKGATTTIKYEIYNIISKIMHGEEINDYIDPKMELDDMPNYGRLKNSFILLEYYLNHPKGLEYFTVDHILTYRDGDLLPDGKKFALYDDLSESLGNLILLDIPKIYADYEKKKKYYSSSHLEEVHKVFISDSKPTIETLKKREERIHNTLLSFFRGEI